MTFDCLLAGRLDKDGLNTKLGQLARRIEEVKVEVYDSLRKKYAEFYPLFDSTTQLQSRVSDLHTDIDAAIAVIEKQVCDCERVLLFLLKKFMP